MTKLTVGTNCFISCSHADAYYKAHGYTRSDVTGKILRGEIRIGYPRKPDGSYYKSTQVSTDSDGRYHVTEE
jgi:hypothetical protein